MLSGTLADDAHCHYVDDADGVRHVLLFTTHQVALEGQRFLYRGKAYRVGDHIEVLGGTTAQTTERGSMVAVDTSACDPDAEKWIVY